MLVLGARLLAALSCISILQTYAYDITGVQTGVKPSGERPARQDLIDFQNSGPAFDLYVQALQRFQVSQTDMLGFFEIAGIHGLPYKAWDGMQISKYALEIAQQYPASTRSQYIAAAENLRIPYWDWASNPVLPSSLINTQIQITTPQGRQSITNPLYSYTINPTTGKGFPSNDPLSRYRTTVRCPDSRGQTNHNLVQSNLRNRGANIRQSTYALFTSQPDYTGLSTRVASSRNLESIHDGIHVAVGGNGHMSAVPWSAFDPVFWLHHANVDRVLALWQAIYPDSWVGRLASTVNTYVTPRGTIETGSTPLKPFHSQGSAFWDSNTSRATRSFGYTYPEIQDWNVTKEELRANVIRKVNELYNSRAANQKRADGDRKVLDLATISKSTFKIADVLKDLARMTTEDFEKLGVNNLEKQWFANIKVDVLALPDPFHIHFFLGDPPSDASTWSSASNLVATFSTFRPFVREPNSMAHISLNELPLSHAIAKAQADGIIKDITQENVVPLLKTHLHWRVQDFNGKEIDVEKLVNSSAGDEPGLAVEVASRDVTPIVGDVPELPKIGDMEIFEEITKGKPGGAIGGKLRSRHFFGGRK
ncbi:predicted protein [Uncinocarpus reesii 1704]|uniref:Tyrosinase copper-binding domain-containing protein n=1 Tax=Uncinocarpus reesii (strain UAMH 1704) TaxID=336963 RepID=C4JZU9_UNCRE|nr:uncharacterized protein UREG_07700 [Uncinocarpus reesii 1704]EEP82835.1 predicted protein [Uncinocarpus reesii 1704]